MCFINLNFVQEIRSFQKKFLIDELNICLKNFFKEMLNLQKRFGRAEPDPVLGGGLHVGEPVTRFWNKIFS